MQQCYGAKCGRRVGAAREQPNGREGRKDEALRVGKKWIAGILVRVPPRQIATSQRVDRKARHRIELVHRVPREHFETSEPVQRKEDEQAAEDNVVKIALKEGGRRLLARFVCWHGYQL